MDYSASTERKPSLKKVLGRLQEFIDAKNVADLLDDEELRTIGQRVVQDAEIDDESRKDWRIDAEEGMKAALQTVEAKNWPFANASNVKYPLITVAALQFNARAYPAVISDDRPVKAKVVGADPDGQKKARADRISEHMSHQLMEEMVEWETDTDTLLMQIPIVGDAFRKVYFDSTLGRNRSEMVPALKFIVNQAVRSLEEAPRYTHELEKYPQEIEEKQRAGVWLDSVVIGPPANGDSDEDAPRVFYEQHRYWDLDGDGYAEPYIITVHEETSQVVRIVANYTADEVEMDDKGTKVLRIAKRDYFVQYPFIPDPSGGFYGIGFYRLLKSLSETINSVINQIIDAGTLQNAGGGFIGSGVRFKKGEIRLKPGVYQTVDASGAKLREAIYSMEHPGPSTVLFQILGLLIDESKSITAVKDLITGDSGNKVQQPTTVVALIEQGLKVFTAIYKRIYRSLKKEFKLLYRLNAENLPDGQYENIVDGQASKEDYNTEDYDICPTADPKSVTDMQKMARLEVLMQFNGDPIIDQREIRKRVLVGTGQEDIEALLPEPPPPPAPDPLTVAKTEDTMASAEKKKAETIKITKETEATEVKDSIEIGQSLAALSNPDEAAMQQQEQPVPA